MTPWTPGQTVYFTRLVTYGPKRGTFEAPTEAVIDKVGKRWATLGREGRRALRFDIATGEVDGGDSESPGHVWRSPAEFEAWQELQAAWTEFHVAVRYLYKAPSNLTAEQVRSWTAAIKEGEDDAES